MMAVSPAPGIDAQLHLVESFQLPVVPFQVQVVARALSGVERKKQTVSNTMVKMEITLVFIVIPPIYIETFNLILT